MFDWFHFHNFFINRIWLNMVFLKCNANIDWESSTDWELRTVNTEHWSVCFIVYFEVVYFIFYGITNINSLKCVFLTVLCRNIFIFESGAVGLIDWVFPVAIELRVCEETLALGLGLELGLRLGERELGLATMGLDYLCWVGKCYICSTFRLHPLVPIHF